MIAADHSFTIGDGRTGFLLIHGLGGTPLELKFVAKGLARQGFTVHCPQLAGHCGDERDLLATDWRRMPDARDAYPGLAAPSGRPAVPPSGDDSSAAAGEATEPPPAAESTPPADQAPAEAEAQAARPEDAAPPA